MDFRACLNTGEKKKHCPLSNQNLVVHLLDHLTNITNTININQSNGIIYSGFI
jgi:hypothetical protein